jgi:hypothetical protein
MVAASAVSAPASRRLLTLATLLTALLALAAPRQALAQARERVDKVNRPFSYYLPNPCTGEYFSAEGELHGQVTQRVNKETGALVEEFTFNARGTAVGVPSGTRYVFHETFRSTFDWDTFEYASESRIRLISPGSEGNAFLVFYFRMGFDENGNLFVEERVESECRG